MRPFLPLILLLSNAAAQAADAGAASSPAVPLKPTTVQTLSLRPAHQAYPAELVKAGVQGTTVVSATLQTDGSVTAPSVQTSSRSPALDDVAIALAKDLRFKVVTSMTSPRPILVPVEFMKDSLATLD